jgi:hypothetical protein
MQIHPRVSRLCSVCRNHHRVLFSCITYHWVCSKSNRKGATSRAGTAHSSGAHVSANDFCGILVALLVIVLSVFSYPFLWLLYCLSFRTFSFGHCIVCLFVPFPLVIVFSVLSYLFLWSLYCLSL